MPDLSIQVQELKDLPGCALITLTGSIDAKTVTAFQSHMNSVRERGITWLIFDMEGVKYVNSTGVGYLINLVDAVEEGGAIFLVRVSANVKVVLEMTGIEFFRFFSSREEATKTLQMELAPLLACQGAVARQDVHAAIRHLEEWVKNHPEALKPRLDVWEFLVQQRQWNEEAKVRGFFYPSRETDLEILKLMARVFRTAGDFASALHFMEKVEICTHSPFEGKSALLSQMTDSLSQGGRSASLLPASSEAVAERANLWLTALGSACVDQSRVLDILQGSHDPINREMALRALVAWPTERDNNYELLREGMLDESEWLNYYFVSTLCAGNPGSIAFLETLVQRKAWSLLRLACLRILCSFEDTRVQEYFVDYLGAPRDEASEDVVVEYFRGYDECVLPSLVRGLTGEFPRGYARAIGRIGTHTALEALVRQVRSPDLKRFAACVAGLKESSAGPAVAILERLAESCRSLKARAEEAADYGESLNWAERLRILLPEEVSSQEIERLKGVSRTCKSDSHDALASLGLPDLVSMRSQIDQEISSRYVKQLAIMLTDMSGFTSWSERHDLASLGSLIARHDQVVRSAIEELGGRVIKTLGDAFLATFDMAEIALSAAREAMVRFKADQTRLPPSHRVSLKIALHYGEVLLYQNDVYGDTVNTVSRIEKCAEPGDIILSYAFLNSMSAPPQTLYLGEKKAKGKTERLRLYKLAH